MSIELDSSLLEAALVGFEAQLARIEEKIAYVKSFSRGGKVSAKPAAVAAAPRKKRKQRREVSEEGRLRMAEAQKRRWAKVRGEA